MEPSQDPIAHVRRIGAAYRRFAVANPALYSLMFERVVGFDPTPELRAEVLERTFGPILEAVRAAAEEGVIEADSTLVAAYTLWTAAHGAVSLELTQSAPKPLSGWSFDRRETGEDVFRRAIGTALRGLSPPGPAVA